MSTWTAARDKVVAFIIGPVWGFLRPIAKIVWQRGGAILLQAAENAVGAGFASGGSNQSRMEVALTVFQKEIKAYGIPFIESQARALIELALQKVKSV